ncbi:hypothetical protein HFA01_20950 [Halobacillus faecis]|uniref:Uncharacterized protein n=1 Tax=Halobacillus faecis TaxID=360184 RepID=A0A511WU76_9BACI|nr:hypothetical protein HFA01_20950 [Halobacillus faecis]
MRGLSSVRCAEYLINEGSTNRNEGVVQACVVGKIASTASHDKERTLMILDSRWCEHGSAAVQVALKKQE